MSSKHTRKQVRCRACGDRPEPGAQCSACLVIGVEPESQELQRIIWALLQTKEVGRLVNLKAVPLDWQLDRVYLNEARDLVELRPSLVKDSTH